MQTYNEILNRLAENDIKYKRKVTNLANDKRGIHGGDLFHAKEQLYQYEILVSRADAKRARELIL